MEQKSSRVTLWEAFGGTIHNKNVGQNGFGRCRKCDAIRNRRQVATRDNVHG